MSGKFNGTMRVKGVGLFHLLPVSHGRKKKKDKEQQDKRKKEKRAILSTRKKGTSIDIIA